MASHQWANKSNANSWIPGCPAAADSTEIKEIWQWFNNRNQDGGVAQRSLSQFKCDWTSWSKQLSLSIWGCPSRVFTAWCGLYHLAKISEAVIPKGFGLVTKIPLPPPLTTARGLSPSWMIYSSWVYINFLPNSFLCGEYSSQHPAGMSTAKW